MKRFTQTIVVIMAVISLLNCKSHAYMTIPASTAYEIFTTNKELVVVDVRETWEYCMGHIPCAINYPWTSGVFSKEYENISNE